MGFYIEELKVLTLVMQMFQTLCIIFTVTTVFYYYFGTSHLQSESNFNKTGILFFLGLAVLTMFLPIKITGYTGLLFDLRPIPIILATMYLKPRNAFIIALATVLIRYLWGGVGAGLWAVGAASYFFFTLFSYKHIFPSAGRSIRLYSVSFLSVVATLTGYAVACLFTESYKSISPYVSLDRFGAMGISLLIAVPVATVIMDTVLQRHLAYQNNYNLHKYNASRDGLTGLYNRRAFDELFERLINSSEEVAILMIDIDKFKNYNDDFGHDQGDLVIKKLAEIMKNKIRRKDVAARCGGDEFAIIIPEINEKMAHAIAIGIQKGMEECNEFKRQMTVSIGVASHPQFDQDNVIKMADVALYQAKENRNTVKMAGPIGETENKAGYTVTY